MKKTILAALLLSSGLAHAAFTGMFASSNWTQTPGTGAVNSFNASFLSISSGNDGSGFASNTDVTIALPAAGTVSFDWDYVTSDFFGDPFYDPFIALTPSEVQLTLSALGGGSVAQSGSYSFSGGSGAAVGFRIRTRDNLFGSATVRISNFNFDDGGGTPAPEPGALALVGVALGAAAWVGRRQRRSRVSALSI
jgi:hypothetical protein